MDKEKDQIVKHGEAKPDAKIEKEKVEIFKFSEEVRDKYVGKNKGTKAEKKLATLEKREAIINEKKAKTEKEGEEVDMKKIITDSLKGVPKLMKIMESIWQRDEEKEAKQKKLVETEKADEQKEVEVVETKEDDIEDKIKNIQKELDNLYDSLEKRAKEELEEKEKKEFERFLNEWCDGMHESFEEANNGKYNTRILRELEGHKQKALERANFVFKEKSVVNKCPAGIGMTWYNLERGGKVFKALRYDPERNKVLLEFERRGEGSDRKWVTPEEFEKRKKRYSSRKKTEKERKKEPDAELETEKMDEAEKEFIRKAAGITLSKIEKWEELNADTEREGDEKFKQKSRELWKNFVVHGRVRFDEKTQKPVIEKHTDLDGKASIKLLNMAGFDVDEKNVEYVAPGGRSKEPGKFHLDTGNKNGIVILEDGTVFIDHHGSESDSSVSTTEFLYRALTGLGLLEKEKHLDDMVKFVNQVDNFKYPNEKEYFKKYFENSWKTLLGLYRMSSMDNLLKFFQHEKHDTGEGLSPAEPLTQGLLKKFKFIFGIKLKEKAKAAICKKLGKSEDELKKMSRNELEKLGLSYDSKKDALFKLSNKSESHRKTVGKQKEDLQKMKKEGFIIDSDAYGKIAINVGGRFSAGLDGAKAFGCGTIIFWNPESSSFFMTSLRGEALRDEFSQGLNVRKSIWVKPMNEGGPLTVKLEKVLEKMTDYRFKPEGKLKEYLEEEKQIKQEKEFTAEEERVIGVFEKYAKKFQKKMEAEADWAGYSDEQKNDTLKIQTAVSVKLKMKEKNLFAGKADEVSEAILSKV